MESKLEAAYQAAKDLLYNCATPHGFVASQQAVDNYKRIFGRDGVITALAALQTGDAKLIRTAKATFNTLARYQGVHGQITSNVDPQTRRVSYGQSAGRVDATLWYVIGAALYYHETADTTFLQKHTPHIQKAMAALATWEYNEKDLLYIPAGGDWADEMPYHGYLLYDQVLYHQAIVAFLHLDIVSGSTKKYWQTKLKRLEQRLGINFWPQKKYTKHELVYYDELYGLQVGKKYEYFVAGFHPHGYYEHFDGFANTLALLSKLGTDSQKQTVLKSIEKYNANRFLSVAQMPVITSKDTETWKKLQGGFQYRFKEQPYEYHNGGLWPMVTGFYIAALMKYNKQKIARQYLEKLAEVNSAGDGFPEYVHGKTGKNAGVSGLAWSAAGYIIGYQAYKYNNII